ncbi:MAG: methyltransferase domain-containing protein [Gemmatimonadetes bacterium]|nr:methyltransferase domain-containing protein [Gemmatimonadota bacterium]NIO30670.1 methyltransferase domain-containing protein [Gemmatimonadota bacterium]
MKRTARAYYADLKTGYSVKIRQLVPKYDEMVEYIVQLLHLHAPRRVLDIGAGIGNVTAAVLESIPAARVTALEVSDEMFREARANLEPAADRVRLVHRDIVDFEPQERYDAVFTNLVLHNLAPDDRGRVLEKLHDWLEPSGTFIWGDYVRHPDERVQEYLIEYRKMFARAAGCPEELVQQNFEKEASDDHPLTIEETLNEGRAAGFSQAFPVWAHDMFAICCLRKAESSD